MAATARLRRQATDQAGAELEDQRGIDGVDRTITIHVRAAGVRNRADQARAKLKDQRGIDGVDLAIAVDVAHLLVRWRRVCR